MTTNLRFSALQVMPQIDEKDIAIQLTVTCLVYFTVKLFLSVLINHLLFGASAGRFYFSKYLVASLIQSLSNANAMSGLMPILSIPSPRFIRLLLVVA